MSKESKAFVINDGTMKDTILKMNRNFSIYLLLNWNPQVLYKPVDERYGTSTTQHLDT